MKMDRQSVVAITGGSRGIGKATALEFAKRGARLVILSRDRQRMELVARQVRDLQSEALVIPTDVTCQDSCQAWVPRVLERFGHIDVLVNNAGVGLYSAIAKLDSERLDTVMKTNLFSALWCTQAVLPHMKDRERGHIVNVSTVVSIRSLPFMSAYCMSKFALNAFDEALRLEVRPFGIRVSLVCPGLTATDFQTNAGKIDHTPPVANDKGVGADTVGRAIVGAVQWSRRRVYLTFAGRMLSRLQRLSPFLVDELAYALMVQRQNRT